MQKQHRIFIAINFPKEIKKILSKYQEKWSDLPARWTKTENIHITLAFLGNLNDEELGEVCMAAKRVSEKHSSFALQLNKIIYGPEEKLPRMVWLLGEKSKELSNLKRDLDNELVESVRFKPENRGFSPHVTLARINQMEFRHLDLEERPEINESVELGFEVASIDVMESILGKGGPEYFIVESFPFND